MESLACRTCCRHGHGRPTTSPRQCNQGDDEPHESADRHSPGHGDDAIGVRTSDDVRETGRTADCVPDGRCPVVVQRRERACGQADEEVRDRRRDDPLESVCTGFARNLGAVPRQDLCEPIGDEQGAENERYADEGKCGREPGRRGRELPGSSRSCQGRENGDADGLRSSHDDDEDAVRGEETVRLVGPPELACDENPDESCEAADDDERCRGQRR